MGKLMAPKILVTNDDGIYSTGLKAAFDSVSDL
ncbi:MAG: 5'/3'-nucleotidase SurE, partial [Methanosarcina sp.]